MPHESYNFGDSLEEVRARLVWRLSLLMIGFGIIAAWYLIVRRDLPLAAVAIPLSFVIFSRVIQLMLNRSPQLARHLLVWGMAAHLNVALLVFSDTLLPYLAVLCVFISAMLIRNGGLINAAVFILVAGLLNLADLRSYPLLDLTVVLLLAAGSSWLSAYTLFTVVHWYSAMQIRSQQLLETTRDHRAELSQALKSLQSAYEVQRHIQLELVWARKHAEDARRLKEQFAANISHELWTPLNLILGFSETMYLSPDVYGETIWTPSLRRDVYQIYRNSQHLLSLIGDILDLSRFEITGFNITPERTSLAPFLKETLEIVELSVQGRAIRFMLSVPADLPQAEIDRTRTRQVILNLLNNACRFTEQGIIELAAKRVEQEIVISVRDTGAGVPADKLPYLFDEFYQVDPTLKRVQGGAGLGLAISKRFVEAHGGRIWVESEEGVGSCFFFTLPIVVHPLPVSQPHETDYPLQDSTIRRCVLVLGAEGEAIPLLERTLKDCDVIQVRNPRPLSEIILMHHPKMAVLNTRSVQPDAVRQILVNSGVPIVECALPNSVGTPEASGIYAYVSQPINAKALLAELERIGTVRHVMIAFSDRSAALLVERMLEASDRGLEIRRVYDFEQAVASLKNRPTDLVILDTVSPNTEGSRLVEYMQRHQDYIKLPIIAITKHDCREETQEKNHFAIYQRDGLYPTETLKFLKAVLEGLSSRFYEVTLPVPEGEL